MNTHGKLGCLLFSLFLALAVMPVVADDKISLGVITRSEPYLVGIGEAKEVSAGRIINKGNVTLTLTAEWVQEEGPRILPVTMMVPKELTLEPDEEYEYFIVVGAPDEDFFGNYTGFVDVVAKPVSTGSGNPTVPAGGLPLTFIVKHLRPAEFIVYSLAVDNVTMMQNETRYASVSVKNIGEMTGTYNMIARVDGQLVTTIPVTLAGDKSKTLDFLLPTNSAGDHSLTVDDCPDTLIYNVMSLPESEKKGEGLNIPIYAVAMVITAFASAGTGLGVVIYTKRKNRLPRRQEHAKT